MTAIDTIVPSQDTAKFRTEADVRREFLALCNGG